MHLDKILGLLTEREATTAQSADRLREQIAALTEELKIDTWLSAGARRRTLGVAGDQRAGQMSELARTPSR